MNGAYLKNIGKVDLSSGSYTAVLYDSDYTPSLTADDTLDDVPGGAIIGSVALANTSFVDGVFDADDAVITSPPAGRVPAGILVYRDGSPALLVLKLDEPAKYSGLGVTTSGADIRITWANDASKIMRFKNPS